MIIDIADLDIVYLSYDEPQKEEFWVKIKNMVPGQHVLMELRVVMRHIKLRQKQVQQNGLY